MKRKIISIVAAICLIIPIAAFSVSAADVTLYTNQRYAYSGTVNGIWKIYSGTNYNNSKHAVYAISEYKNKDTTDKSKRGEWTEDVYTLMSAGSSFENARTKKHNSTDWRLELNPQYWNTSGCSAKGSIIY